MLQELISQSLAIDVRFTHSLVKSIIEEQRMSSSNDHYLSENRKSFDVTFLNRKSEIVTANPASQSERSIIAVAPIFGTITRHGYSTWDSDYGGTLQLGRKIEALDRNKAVGSIVLHINSPGGSVYGTEELSNVIYAIRERGETHITAVVDPLMASAATWIGTSANEVVAIPSSDSGSIGVISIYANYAKAFEEYGIDISVLRIPEKKARFTGVEPLTEEMEAEIVRRNEEAYDKFVADMARNRKVSIDHVKSKFGGGEVLNAFASVKAGLLDRIGTLDQVIQERITAIKPDSSAAKRRASVLGLN